MNMRRGTYLKFYEEFDKICSKLDEIPDIEIVNEPRCRSSIKGDTSPLVSMSPKLTYIIKELKKRIRSSPKNNSVTGFNRFKFRSQLDDKIGPGSYLLNTKGKSESHQFSTIPRLNTPITHSILNIENFYPAKGASSKEIIKKNKLLAAKPELNRSLIQSRISTEKLRKESIKERKKNLDLLDQKEKKNRLKNKDKLFEWRVNKATLNSVKKSWILMDAIFGFAFVLKCKGQLKKKLKNRWEVVLRKFVVALKAVGKMVKMLNRIRKKIRERTLSNLFFPSMDYIKLVIWNNRKLIQGILIEYSDLPYLSKLMVKVKFCVLKVQRCFQNFRKIRRARMEGLKLMWEEGYKNFIKENPDKAGAVQRIGAIKKQMVEKYLSGLLRDVVIKYVSELNIFLLKCAEEMLSFESTWRKVNRPRIFIYRKKEKILSLVEKAIKFQDIQQKKQRYLKYSSLN